MPETSHNCLENFDLIKTVGTGTFSRVYLCQQKHHTKYQAIKIVPINEVIRNKQVQQVNNEREILQKIKNPFLISLVDCWKDDHNLYFLFPFHCGGELFTLMRMYERLSSTSVSFYSAEIVSALAYLHSLDVVYRDLKPENILLDREGHVVITDFGFAKMTTCSTWTVCGTPEYLAPEVLQGRGSTKAVDWWSLGILMYEMLTGQPPFTDSSLMGLYEKIVRCEIVWRDEVFSLPQETKDLVLKLLHPDEKFRLGTGSRGTGEVLSHSYFSRICWPDVNERKLKPPIVPSVNSDQDTRYFNFYQENDINIADSVSVEDLKLFKDF